VGTETWRLPFDCFMQGLLTPFLSMWDGDGRNGRGLMIMGRELGVSEPNQNRGDNVLHFLHEKVSIE